jgi:hypothetical protein
LHDLTDDLADPDGLRDADGVPLCGECLLTNCNGKTPEQMRATFFIRDPGGRLYPTCDHHAEERRQLLSSRAAVGLDAVIPALDARTDYENQLLARDVMET